MASLGHWELLNHFLDKTAPEVFGGSMKNYAYFLSFFDTGITEVLRKDKTHLSYKFNAMAVDDLVTTGAKASAAMVFFFIHPVFLLQLQRQKG